MRVLIVDDSSANGEALRDLLTLEGAQVTVESSPASAIARAGTERFDIVISDIAMPDMSGYELARRIRQQVEMAQPVLVALTGYGQSTDREAAFAAGFDLHLTKPVSLDQLMAMLRALSVPPS